MIGHPIVTSPIETRKLPMAVTTDDIRDAITGLNLAGHPVCVHSSLRSFGKVEGGAAAIIAGFAAVGCTLLVPTFSYRFSIPPPPDQRPARNGWDYDSDPDTSPGTGLVYTPDSPAIDRSMGALPAAVLARPERARGDHALNSFAAIGPLAHSLVSRQRPLDVYGPLKGLAEADGFVLLMGVGPERMTPIHLAEMMAGRQLFRRWANGPDGRPMMVETGGCSEGFGNLAPTLARLAATRQVGSSRWLAVPARSTLEALADAIRARSEVTWCGDPGCGRCADAIAGGPILLAEPD